jgi:hypothetical protein
MSGRRKRGGQTIVETLVAVTLLLILGGGIVVLLSRGRGHEARVDARLDGLRGAVLVASRLGEDFSQLIPFVGAKTTGATHGEGVVFDRITEETLPDDVLPVSGTLEPKWQTMTYSFDEDRKKLLRNGKELAGYESVELAFDPTSVDGYTVQVTLEGGLRPATPAPAQSIGCRYKLAFHSPLGTLAVAHRDWVGHRGI